jgi:hypothetical protein
LVNGILERPSLYSCSRLSPLATCCQFKPNVFEYPVCFLAYRAAAFSVVGFHSRRAASDGRPFVDDSVLSRNHYGFGFGLYSRLRITVRPHDAVEKNRSSETPTATSGTEVVTSVTLFAA